MALEPGPRTRRTATSPRVGGRGLDLTLLTAIVALATSLGAVQLARPIHWPPDGLFYQARVLEIRGEGHEQSLRDVVSGPLARERLRQEAAGVKGHHFSDPKWVSYSSRFYHRRWLVPALAAAIYPLFHERSLQIVSLLGYVLFAGLLFLLLRRRYPAIVSFLVAAVCLLLPNVRVHAFEPLTDSLSLALETGALLVALLVLDRDRRWLPIWVATILLLSLTRDAAVIPIAGVAWIAIRERSRLAGLLAISGVIAAAPAQLFLGAPLRETIAYTFNGFNIPHQLGWAHLASEYPSNIHLMLYSEKRYAAAHVFVGAVFVLGLLGLFLIRTRRDRYVRVLRASGVVALLSVYVIPQASRLRLEMVVLPMAATGIARFAEVVLSRLSRSDKASTPPR